MEFCGYVQLVPLLVHLLLSSELAPLNQKRFERVSIPYGEALVTLDVTAFAVRICEDKS